MTHEIEAILSALSPATPDTQAPGSGETLARVDAVKWNGRGFTIDDGGPPKWLLDAVQSLGTPDKVVGAAMRMRDEVHIGTRFGVMVARPGDWIVRYSTGEIGTLTDFEYAMSGIVRHSPPRSP